MSFPQFLRDNAPFLGAGALLTFSSSFGQTYFISIFAGEIQGAFGLSHGAWGSIYAAGTLGAAAVMVWAGTLTDQFRIRALSAICLIALALACVTMAVNPFVWALPFIVFFLRLFGQGMSSHMATVSMARWFVATRGRALAIASLGFSAGESLLPVIFVALLGLADWRTLWLIAAGILMVILPIVRWLLTKERTPQSMAEDQGSLGLDGRHWTRAEVLRHPTFWAVVPAILGFSALVTALFFFQVHLTEVKGWRHLDYVALFPFYTASAVTAMILSGWAIDRVGTPRLLMVYLLPVAAGFYVMAGAETLFGATVAMMMGAFTGGMMATVLNAFWAEFYGTKNLGAIRSVAMAVMVLGSAIGPWFSGLLIDRGILLPDQMPYFALFFAAESAILTMAILSVSHRLPRAA